MNLTALRNLGNLADAHPVIIVGTREQDPLAFARLPWRPGMLPTGDYSVGGLEEKMNVRSIHA
ncbi:MAG TPA: hypothetical protein VGD78_09885 [Chthoniobacterales bacterium]